MASRKNTDGEFKYEDCWACLMRLLRREDPMSFKDALKMVQRAQKDPHYRRH